MSESDRQLNFRETLKAAQGGCEQAFQKLIEDYGDKVLLVLKRQLSQGLRTKVDEDDLAQMVWVSFYRIQTAGRDFGDETEFIRFLIGIAKNKALNEAKHFRQQKRDLDKEDGSRADMEAARSDLDTPSQFAIFNETLERILEGLDDFEQQVVLMRLGGMTKVDIAKQLGCDESTVRRALRKAEERGFGRFESE